MESLRNLKLSVLLQKAFQNMPQQESKVNLLQDFHFQYDFFGNYGELIDICGCLGQLIAWALTVLIFFDDYSNVLIAGSSMAPVTDRLFVSPEKLAFIIDATAAPICSLAPVSSWIGFEVALIADIFQRLDIQEDAYITFLKTIIYRFYSIVMLLIIPIGVLMKKEFGPMVDAQARARLKQAAFEVAEKEAEERRKKRSSKTNYVELEENEESDGSLNVEKYFKPPVRPITAILPLIVTVLAVVLAMILHGYYNLKYKYTDLPMTIPNIFSHTDSFSSLTIGSFTGCVVAIFLVLIQRLMNFAKALDAWNSGTKIPSCSIHSHLGIQNI